MNRRMRSRPTIIVRNVQRKVAIATAGLQNFADRALTTLLDDQTMGRGQLCRLADISILLVSDQRMSVLHRRFLDTPGPTDVITFHHGEIFISTETARRHARQFKTSTLREIQLYIVHGLLHLNGCEDQSKSGARRMEVAQRRILAATGIR